MSSSHKEGYSEWAARMEKKRMEETFKKRRQQKEDEEQKRERKKAAKEEYQEWLKKKSKHDRAIEVLQTLKLKDVDFDVLVLALAAVQISLGDMKKSKLFARLTDWARVNYTFQDKLLSEEAAQAFSRKNREFWERNEEGMYQVLSIPFTFDDSAKARTSDDLAFNALFTDLLKKSWSKARRSVKQQLQTPLESIKAIKKAEEAAKLAKLGLKPEPEDGEEEAKGDASSAAPDGSSSAPGEGDGFSKPQLRLLHVLGMGKLNKLAEAVRERLQTEADEEAEGGKTSGVETLNTQGPSTSAFEEWVKQRDRSRIRVPQAMLKGDKNKVLGWKPPRFDFSGKGVTRKKPGRMPTNTLAMLAGSGLNVKYIHAPKGARDLQASREAVLKAGFVSKENFKDPDEGDLVGDGYYQHKQAKRAAKAQREKEEVKRQEKYELWAKRKAWRDQAVDCLQYIPLTQLEDEADQRETWLEVGKAMKGVDATLLGEWAKWASAVPDRFPFTTCAMYWDSFEPIACDIHATSSAVKDTLVKLLHKADVDFKALWEDYVERQQRRHDGEYDESKGLNPRQFARLMGDAGIAIKKQEVRHVFQLFDADQNGSVSMEEFLNFVGSNRKGRGDTEERLASKCVWDKACHKCGMAAAYDTVVQRPAKKKLLLADGPAKPVRVRKNLKDHKLAARQRFHLRGARDEPPEQCPAASWSDAQRKEDVDDLMVMAKPLRDAAEREKKLLEGEKPLPPQFMRDDDAAVEDVAALSTSIPLKWDEAKGSEDVFFYVLETLGAEGSPEHAKGEWSIICTDPETRGEGARPVERFVHTGLHPNASYHYRLRGFNAHGASSYVFRVFTTSPETPPAPVVLKAGPTVVTLAWREGLAVEMKRRLEQLEKVFHDADADRSGEVSREELMVAIKKSRKLEEFLRRAKVGDGGSVFDMVEKNDDATLSWDEFSKFFQESGALVAPSSVATETARGSKASQRRSSRSSQRSHHSQRSQRSQRSNISVRSAFGGDGVSVHSSASTRARRKKAKLQPVVPPTYILQQCVSDPGGEGGKAEEAEWEKVYEGRHQKRQVPNLRPGTSYKFRVVVVSSDGVKGVPSTPTVVNTALLTPDMPQLAGAVSGTSVTLKWSEATNTRFQPQQNKEEDIMSKWAGFQPPNFAESSGGIGVNLLKAFNYYDTNGNGTIDLTEFTSLMEDLGQPLSDWRLKQAFATLDGDGSGTVDFEEFTKWWKEGEVTYVLKRSHGVAVSAERGSEEGGANIWSNAKTTRFGGTQASVRSLARRDAAPSTREESKLADSSSGSSPEASMKASHAVYKGSSCRITLDTLEPNRCYWFFLRHVSSRAVSALSPPLKVVTPPLPAKGPVVVQTTPRTVLLRWYPGQPGTFKYIVESCLVEQLPGSTRSVSSARSSTRRRLAKGGSKWEKAYEGRATFAILSGLLPNSYYRFRVATFNGAGMSGGYSAMTEGATADPAEYDPPSPENSTGMFTMSCAAAPGRSGDLVVGDTILFTEPVLVALQQGADYARKDALPPEMPKSKGGEYLCDRTICALVVAEKEVQKGSTAKAMAGTTARLMTPRSGTRSVTSIRSQQSTTRGGKKRVQVYLQVVWSQSIGPPYTLDKAARIRRDKHKLLALDGVMRRKWDQEDRRWPAEAEERVQVQSF